MERRRRQSSLPYRRSEAKYAARVSGFSVGTVTPISGTGPSLAGPAPLRARSPMAATTLRRVAEVLMTFGDIAVYFSRKEWLLLNEAQRRLYLDVMLENYALISSLGCCCGAEDVEAPSEQNITVRVSKAVNLKSAHSSQKSHPCESCGRVLRNIFFLVDQQGPTLLRCGACAKPFYFSAQTHQQGTTQNGFIGSVDRVSLENSCKFYVPREPSSSSQVGKCLLVSSGHREQLAAWSMSRRNKISKFGMTFNTTKYYIPRQSKKTIGGDDKLENQRFLTRRKCFLCCECGKSFIRISAFRAHQRLHTRERVYKCGECGKSFTQNIILRRHQKVHTGESLYECGQCRKSFTHSSSLRLHHRVHSKDRAYECSQCGRSFPSRYAFHCHQRVHTGEKPYECSECKKCFRQSSTLIQHYRVHSGEKLF
ncbi:zinc finger protein 211-like [Artibeus jamaicensis]|uniref:zinc finger protein 211-like n=1 Tax=Artibeus jamaicensis TaxID=9417 RepID=UPI00235B2855|nr:zinc finger protein 211-like [Artibeus jamaicensis]